MRLYIANATRQVQEIHYRLDFNERGQQSRFYPARRQSIPPGRQVLVGNESMHPEQVETIVRQLQRYGMVAVEDVKRNLRGKAPLIFNVEQPVPQFVIENVVAINSSILLEEGRQRRARAAVAANSAVEAEVARSFAAAGLDREAKQTVDVEFEQLEQSEAGERRIEEGFRVREGGATSLATGKSGRNAPWSAERRARFEASKPKGGAKQ